MAAIATDVTPASLRQQAPSEAAHRRTDAVRRGRNAETPGVFSAASKSIEYSDRLRTHYRETRRMPAEIQCSVELVLMDGTLYDAGAAEIQNISPSGALLGCFELKGGNFPAELFKIRMVLHGNPYEGIGIEATPVRFASGTHGIGVKFDEIFVAV